MKRKFNLVLAVAGVMIVFSTLSCRKSTSTYVGDFKALPVSLLLARYSSVSFVIGGIAYVGTGFDAYDNSLYLKDFASFNAANNTWSIIKPMPDAALARKDAVAFSINGMGYVGGGFYTDALSNRHWLNDFWQYNPTTNSWSQAASLPIAGLQSAVAFVLNNKAYVGTGTIFNPILSGGQHNDIQRFYKFDPLQTDTAQHGKIGAWDSTSVPPYPGQPIHNAFSFVIGSLAYVGGGISNSSVSNGFYAYNDQTNAWTQRSRLDSTNGAVRKYQTVSFTINGKGYIVTGATSGYGTTDCFEYNPSNDTWTQKTSFEGSPRILASGWSLDGTAGYRGFLCLGTGSTSGQANSDLWSFDPDATKNDNNNHY